MSDPIVRAFKLAYGLAVFVATMRAPTTPPRGASPARAATPSEPEDVPDALGDDFLFDAVSRANEAIVANVDAIDTALMAILGANAAFAVLAVDKVRELAPLSEGLALGCFIASALASTGGYAWGVFFAGGAGARDALRPLRFVASFAQDGSQALADAIAGVVDASERNLRIRRAKRLFAVLAVLLFLAGATTVAIARLTVEPGA